MKRLTRVAVICLSTLIICNLILLIPPLDNDAKSIALTYKCILNKPLEQKTLIEDRVQEISLGLPNENQIYYNLKKFIYQTGKKTEQYCRLVFSLDKYEIDNITLTTTDVDTKNTTTQRIISFDEYQKQFKDSTNQICTFTGKYNGEFTKIIIDTQFSSISFSSSEEIAQEIVQTVKSKIAAEEKARKEKEEAERKKKEEAEKKKREDAERKRREQEAARNENNLSQAISSSSDDITIIKYFDIPSGYGKFKSYMSYRAITNTSSRQYRLQQYATTNENGIRCIAGYPMIACASTFGRVGDTISVKLSGGGTYTFVIGDIKHGTDFVHHDGSVLEFIVDTNYVPSCILQLGSFNSIYNGTVQAVAKVDVASVRRCID